MDWRRPQPWRNVSCPYQAQCLLPFTVKYNLSALRLYAQIVHCHWVTQGPSMMSAYELFLHLIPPIRIAFNLVALGWRTRSSEIYTVCSTILYGMLNSAMLVFSEVASPAGYQSYLNYFCPRQPGLRSRYGSEYRVCMCVAMCLWQLWSLGSRV